MGTVFPFPYRTVAEISLSAIIKNLYVLRNISGKEIIPIVKADAYGHGMVPVTRALIQRGGVSTIAVATLEEALELRKKTSKHSSIIVLSGFFPHQLDAYIRYNLIPMIHSLSHLKSLEGLSRLPNIHLKIDTGMHRLGIKTDEINEAIHTLKKIKIKLSGLATHFANSDEKSSYIQKQIKTFETIYYEFKNQNLLNTDAKIHISNTGGILRRKLSISNAVRPGLGLFGISPNPEIVGSEELLPVLKWKTRILTIKKLNEGEKVGYGLTYKAQKDEKIAIIPVGYADGFCRSLSNIGHVIVCGKKAPIIGKISMDMATISINKIHGVKENIEVTIIGKDGKENNSAWNIAHWAKTIPYEILCGISPRVPRVYLD